MKVASRRRAGSPLQGFVTALTALGLCPRLRWARPLALKMSRIVDT